MAQNTLHSLLPLPPYPGSSPSPSLTLPYLAESLVLLAHAHTVSAAVVPVMPVFMIDLLGVSKTLIDAAAAYYTSFASVGIVIYLIRTRQGYRSLPEAINERYGSMATLAFGLAVLFRLYQEVWSNALVVAGFYGDVVCLCSLVCFEMLANCAFMLLLSCTGHTISDL